MPEVTVNGIKPHVIEAITEGGKDEAHKAAKPLIDSIVGKLGNSAGPAVERLINAAMDAGLNAGINFVVDQLTPDAMDIKTDGQVTATLDLG